MKRLLDESPDELTRSLLVAGIEHQPDPGNKARVIMALGAGGTFGLLSSNAFAWLGTTAGKVTAAGVAVGVAGAMFIAAPQLLSSGSHGEHSEAAPHAAQGVNATALAAARAGSEAPGTLAPGGSLARGEVSATTSAPATSLPEGSSVAATAAAATSVATTSGAVSSAAVSSAAVSSAAVTSGPTSPVERSTAAASRSLDGASGATEGSPLSGKAATKKLAAWRERRLAAHQRALGRRAVARQERSAEVAAASETAGSTGSAPDGAVLLAAKDDLDSEVRLVDDMHWAARHNDREALSRFLERYREAFPDGQLKNEVSEFAARLERDATDTRSN